MSDINAMFSNKQFKVNNVDEYSYKSGATDMRDNVRNNLDNKIKDYRDKLKKIEEDIKKHKNKIELNDFFTNTRQKSIYNISALNWVINNCL